MNPHLGLSQFSLLSLINIFSALESKLRSAPPLPPQPTFPQSDCIRTWPCIHPTWPPHLLASTISITGGNRCTFLHLVHTDMLRSHTLQFVRDSQHVGTPSTWAALEHVEPLLHTVPAYHPLLILFLTGDSLVR